MQLVRNEECDEEFKFWMDNGFYCAEKSNIIRRRMRALNEPRSYTPFCHETDINMRLV